MKKLVSLAVAASLVLAAPGTGALVAFAQDPRPAAPTVSEAMGLFQRHNVVTGAGDPKLRYLLRGEGARREVSPLGELVVRYLRALESQRGVDPEAAADTERKLSELLGRFAGSDDRELREARLARVDELTQGLRRVDISSEDIYAVGSALEAVLTGADQAQRNGGTPDFWVEEEGDYLVAYERRTGRMYRKEHRRTGAVVYARELVERQEQYNDMVRRGEVRGAPLIPEENLGQLTFSTLMIPHRMAAGQLEKMEESFNYMELLALLEITNSDRNYRPDQLTHRREQGVLLAELRDKTVPGGRRASELLHPNFRVRNRYLENARQALQRFEALARSVENAATVPPDLMTRLDALQKEVSRHISLAWLEGQIYVFQHQNRRMGDAEFQRMVDEAPVPADERARFGAQRGQLAERARQLTELYTRLKAALMSADFEEKLAVVQALVAESQGLGQSYQLATMAFSQTASLLKMAHETNSANDRGLFGTGLSIKGATDFWARVGHEHFGIWGGHVANVEAVARGEGRLRAAFGNISSGNYRLAVENLKGLAVPGDRFEGFDLSARSSLTDIAQMQGAMGAFQKRMQDVQDVHFWTEYASLMILNAAAAGVLAPTAGRILTGVERGAVRVAQALDATRRASRVVYYASRPIAWSARALGTVARSFAYGLSSLEPTTSQAYFRYRTLGRAYNMLKREIAVSGTLGLLSGGIESYRASRNGLRFWEANPTSAYRSSGEAFWRGFKFGMKFPIEPENLPWLFAGVPGNLFGTSSRLGRAWFNFSRSGLVGGTVDTVLGREVVAKGLMKLSETGALGNFVSGTVGFADQIAKYFVGAYVIGKGAEQAHYWSRAAADAWSGRHREPTEAEIRGLASQRGVQEHEVREQLAEETRVREVQRVREAQQFGMKAMEHGWRFIPVFPGEMMVNVEGYYGSRQGYQQYAREGHLFKIANAQAGGELPMYAPTRLSLWQRLMMRGMEKRTPEARQFTVSEEMVTRAIREELTRLTRSEPAELYRVLEARPDSKIGELRVRDEVKAEARDMLESVLQRDPAAARELMTRPESTALRLLEARDPALAGELNGGPRAAEARRELTRIEQGIREEVALAVLQNRIQGGFFSRIASAFRGGRSAENFRLAKEILEPYVRSELRANRAGESFIEAVRGNERPSEALGRELDGWMEQARDWRQQADRGATQKTYSELVREWREKLESAQGLSEADLASARALLDYIDAVQARFDTRKTVGGEEVPLIHDAGGTPIQRFRPEQFEVMLEYLTHVARGSGVNLRAYQLLATGGGKTLLVFEGLLPMILAHAQAAGGKKVVFTTTQTNLVAQARMDYKAFRKILSDVEILSFETFKSRIAEGKMWGRSRPEDHWVIADEMDAMSLTPALTIGEQTATVSRQHPAFRRLHTVADELAALSKLDRMPAGERAAGLRRLRTDVRRSLEEGVVVDRAAAREVRLRFDRLAERVERLRTGEGRTEDLASLRKELKEFREQVDRAVQRENPLYEAFRAMSQDAVRLTDSPLRENGLQWRRSRERLEHVGREAVEAAQKGDAVRARRLAEEGLRLSEEVRVTDPAKVQAAREALLQLAEAASGRARLTPDQIRALGRRFRDALSAGVRDIDVVAAFEKDLSRRTRGRAWELMRALRRDPYMDIPTRTAFFLKFFWSLLTGKGWVRAEILHMAEGRLEGNTNVRMDNRTGKVHPQHGGEWNPTLDTPTRRWHELENGADLTLPYEHREIATVRDIIERPRVNFLGVSGTIPEPLRAFYGQNNAYVGRGGTPNNMPENLMAANPSAKFNMVANRYQAGLVNAPKAGRALEELVTARARAEGAPQPRIEAELASLRAELARATSPRELRGILRRHGVEDLRPLRDAIARDALGGELLRDPGVRQALEAALRGRPRAELNALRRDLARIERPSDVPGVLARHGVSDAGVVRGLETAAARRLPSRDAVQDALRAWAEHGGRDLLVVGFSNTRDLKAVLEMFDRMGVDRSEIAKIFSDTEYIRTHYPEADVARQMNLAGLGTGRIKILLVDMRVGGRGLDMPFRRGGYRNAEILILDPHLIAEVHDVQFQGRTAPNRMRSDARRDYYYLTDMQTASVAIRQHPTLEARIEGPLSEGRAWELLGETQLHVERNQLRSSSVLQDAPMTGGDPLIQSLQRSGLGRGAH